MSTISLSPYRNDSTNQVYELMFCDRPEIFRPANNLQQLYPWNILFSAQPDTTELVRLTEDKNLESRIKLLAHHQLMVAGKVSSKRELLGVIAEVGMEGGLDTLAAYSDGTARYINYTESMIIWETRTTASDKIINHLFDVSLRVVNQIGPWNKPRLAAPQQNDIRLSFLMSDGLYFGQGPLQVLSRDAMGAPVVQAATDLLVFLTNQPKK